MPYCTTKEGDVLDALVWSIFGECSDVLLALVHDLNPGLSGHGPILPCGLVISLPEHKPEPPQALDTGVKLWD